MDDKIGEVIKKYGIDISVLESEQKKLAEDLIIEDKIDFSSVHHVGAVDIAFFMNRIISGAVVCDLNLEILEKDYFNDKIRFPYIPGFRAYREVPSMVSAFKKMGEIPDLVFVRGDGIIHPRLGLASHFSLLTGVPTIGINDKLNYGEVRGEDIIVDGEIKGKVLISKKGSKPIYVSPGNLVSVKTALEMSRKFLRFPHKLPEPLHLAQRYSKKIRDEIRVL